MDFKSFDDKLPPVYGIIALGCFFLFFSYKYYTQESLKKRCQMKYDGIGIITKINRYMSGKVKIEYKYYISGFIGSKFDYTYDKKLANRKIEVGDTLIIRYCLEEPLKTTGMFLDGKEL